MICGFRKYPSIPTPRKFQGEIDFKSQGGGACGRGGGGDFNLKDLPWGCGYFLEPDNIDIKLIEYLAVIYSEFLGSNHCVRTCSSVDRS